MIHRPGISQIEKHFSMPFIDVIEKLHWKGKRSIKSLSDECGISRDTFQKNAKRLGIKLRSHIDSINIEIENRSGENHWAFGLTKDNSEWAKRNSDRMKRKNPSHNKDIISKCAKTKSETYRRNPWPQEKLFLKILDDLRVSYIFQYPIGSYIIDFFHARTKTCIEIDSIEKWDRHRHKNAAIKDKILNDCGYSVLRINKAHIKDRPKIIDILKTHNII